VSVSFLQEVDLGSEFGPFVAFRDNLGFVPRLLQAQTLLPRVIEAQEKFESALCFRQTMLSRVQKERILLVVATALRDAYCAAIHGTVLASLGVAVSGIDELLADYRQAGLAAADVTLLDFCVKLGCDAPSICREDIDALRACGFDDEVIQEAVAVAGLAVYRQVLSVGLGPEPEFQLRRLPEDATLGGARDRGSKTYKHSAGSKKGPYIRVPYRSPINYKAFALLQSSHGFIPNFFRSQTLRPDLLEAEAEIVTGILMPENVLNRFQKECILLAVSGANLNSYCVAVHCNLLRGLGMTPEHGDQIAVDHTQAELSAADRALLDFALKVGTRPAEFGPGDVARLREFGFTEEQILECVVVTALNNFANTVQMGLGIVPDFEPPELFEQNKVHLPSAVSRPNDERTGVETGVMSIADPDAALVVRAKAGDLDAFEELLRRQTRCIYRVLLAILGDPEEAKDAMQNTFLSAFKHLAEFQGRSKFSTWLVSIARNAAIERLRKRKEFQSLDEGPVEGEEEFRPRQVRAWSDNPEQTYSKSETRQLVEDEIMKLPAKYRVVVMLRDVEQLTTDEVARELGISVPALKARLIRGRLMLRESLSPYFTSAAGRVAG